MLKACIVPKESCIVIIFRATILGIEVNIENNTRKKNGCLLRDVGDALNGIQKVSLLIETLMWGRTYQLSILRCMKSLARHMKSITER